MDEMNRRSALSQIVDTLSIWVSASSAAIINTCRVPAEEVQLSGLTSSATGSEETPCQQEQVYYTISLTAWAALSTFMQSHMQCFPYTG